MSIGAVAKRAGVSVTTVCRVLKGFPSVQAKTAQQVRKAIRELGYRPVRTQLPAVIGADSVEQIRGQAFAIVCLGNEKQVLKRPDVQAAIEGMREAAEQLGIELTFQKHAVRKNCRGGLLFGDAETDERGIRSLPEHLPFVRVLSAEPSRVRMDNVSSDPAIVGQMAYEFFATQRCEAIAFVTEAPELPAMQSWARALVDSAKRAHREASVFLVSANRRMPAGFPCKSQLLKSLLALPEQLDLKNAGLFVPSISSAQNLLATIEGKARVKVVSCEGDPEALLKLDPSIACIDLQWRLAGRMAVQQLVHRILNLNTPTVRVKIAPVWHRA